MNKSNSLRALMLGLACMSAGSGLTNIAVPARAIFLQFDTVTIGVLTGLYYLGFVISCFQTPRLVARVGHIRGFICSAALVGICTLGYILTDLALAWGIFRFAGGFCVASIYMIVESWVNDTATPYNRGRIITIYRVVDLSSVVIGQVIIGLFDTGGTFVFLCANVLMNAGVIPMALTTTAGPAPLQDVRFDWQKVWRVSRIASASALVAGICTGSYFGLGPSYAEAAGIGRSLLGLFMAAPLVGAVLFQLVLGRLADKYDRERLLSAVGLGAAGAGLLLGAIANSTALSISAMFIWGAVSIPIYSLAIAIANDRCRADDFLDVSGGLLLIYSLGAIVGPALASLAMDYFSHHSLFIFTAAAHIGLAAYAVGRRNLVIEPVDLADRDEYFAAPRNSPIIFEMDPRHDSEHS